jgi:hypothetical protein
MDGTISAVVCRQTHGAFPCSKAIPVNQAACKLTPMLVWHERYPIGRGWRSGWMLSYHTGGDDRYGMFRPTHAETSSWCNPPCDYCYVDEVDL